MTDIYALPKACIFCEEEAGQFELCADHLAEFINWKRDGNVTDWLAFKIRTLRAEVNETLQIISGEVKHIRGRARECLKGDIAGQHLANSVLLHTERFSGES